MAPHRLKKLRWTRADQMGVPREPYTALGWIHRELLYTQSVAALYRWRTVGTTGRSVEEVG